MVNKSDIQDAVNYVTESLIVYSSEENFDVIRNALEKNGVPSNWYSLGLEKEESVNLIYENQHWKVTTVEKGARHFERQYDDIDSASKELFSKLSRTSFKRNQMNRYYNKHKVHSAEIKRDKVAEFIEKAFAKMAMY